MHAQNENLTAFIRRLIEPISVQGYYFYHNTLNEAYKVLISIYNKQIKVMHAEGWFIVHCRTTMQLVMAGTQPISSIVW